ncbi:MAG: ABC-2 transporter permease [Anaerolineae bacterium]|nr:ABC-2 transporter permease [Anaerolineae bacterium]
MSSKRTLTLACRVVLQLLRDRRTLALILFMPLVVLTIVGILVRVAAGDVALGVVNEDTGTSVLVTQVNLGDAITEKLQAMDRVTVRLFTPEDAADAITAGAVDAVVTFAPAFSADARAAGHITLDATFEGSDPMAGMQANAVLLRAGMEAMAGLARLGLGAGAPSFDADELPVEVNAAYRYGGPEFDSLDYIAPAIIAIFVFLFVYLLTSVAFLRERTAGTLERLQATAVSRTEIMIGYMLGFSVFALAQSVIILLFTVFALGVHYKGNLLVVFIVELLLTFVSVDIGIFLSTFARNEFQAVQFMPLIVVIQVLLSGVFWAIEDMPAWLQPAAWLMPLTYANRALRDVMIKGFGLGDIWPYLVALLGFGVLMIAAGAATIGRQRA